jgi:predicted acyl esterase
MVGLSYPGITQLFVASTQPPGLAAIAPSSVIGNSATTILPGGILNEGFALTWVSNVISKAAPYGQGWEQARVDMGDTICAENQLLHTQLVDNVQEARMTTYYDPAKHDRLNPTTFVNKINVPVFLSCAFQDEQTGPYFFTMLDKFTSAPALRENIYNGVHVDAFQPEVLEEWRDFLELYVAQRVPIDIPIQRSLSPALFMNVYGTSAISLPDNRFTGMTSYADALAMWKAEPHVRVLFEDGAGTPPAPGAPEPTFEKSFTAWPPTETMTKRLYFHADGSLADVAPTDAFAASTFTLDPDAGNRGILAPGGNVWDMLPNYDWREPAPGSAVIFESAPLTEDVEMLGSASADLWIRSPVDDADLEINLIEVRPDGQERYVQSGWLRASLRGLGPDSTELWPSPTYQEKDHAALVPGQWTQARVGVPAFAHVFRAGSKIRVSVDTPGDSRAAWTFKLKTFPGTVAYDIGHDAAHSSSIALPVIAGATVATPLPACPSLRGQQCRAYQPYTNVPASP